MTANVTTSFIDMWNDEVHHVFQQEGSKLRECVRAVTGVTGSTHKFHKLGSVVAAQGRGTRHDDLADLDPAHSVPSATLIDFYAPIYIDKLDEVKTNADFRREYVKTSARAIGRAMDDEIIVNGLEASAGGTEVVDASGGFTLTKVLEAKKALDLADVPMYDRYFVVSPAAMQELLDVTEATSADYQNVKALVQGNIDTAFGFKWIMSTRLTKAGSPTTERLNWAFSKDAVGCAIGYDLTTEVNYIPEKTAYLVNSMLSLGSVNIDNTGIVQVGTTDSDPDNNSLT